jgi:hypothetical protein
MDLDALDGYLKGVALPATKDELIKCATEAGAPEEFLETMRAHLQSESYADLQAVHSELTGVRTQRNPPA